MLQYLALYKNQGALTCLQIPHHHAGPGNQLLSVLPTFSLFSPSCHFSIGQVLFVLEKHSWNSYVEKAQYVPYLFSYKYIYQSNSANTASEVAHRQLLIAL